MTWTSRGEADSSEPLLVPLWVWQSITGVEAVLVVAGELDVFSAPRLRQAVQETLRCQVRRIVVDVSEVAFIDVLGLNILVGIAKACRERAVEFSLRNPSDDVVRIQELVGLDETVLPVEEDGGQVDVRPIA